MKLAIKNGLVVFPDSEAKVVDILIEDGKITGISSDINYPNAEEIDAQGKYVLPGLIDMHCHLCDPGYEYMENLETASISALKGGFTSITCQPNTSPTIDNKAIVEYVLSKSRNDTDINIFPYGSMTKECKGKLLSEIGEMKLAGVIALSDGDISIMDSNIMRKILLYSKMFDLPVITHCEDTSISNDNLINEGIVSTYLGLKGSPSSAEEIMVARNILLASDTNSHIHISNVSTKGSVEIIRQAKKQGIRVTAGTSPHYFTLTEKAVLDFNTFAKVNPPLRTEEDVKAILEGLKDKTIDVISSGHSPKTYESKKVEYENASHGISSFETAFSLCYTNLVDKHVLSIEELVEKMVINPAQILALNKGKIGLGLDADIIIVDHHEEYEVNSKNFSSKANFSPYDGVILKGRIIETIVNGKRII